MSIPFFQNELYKCLRYITVETKTNTRARKGELVRQRAQERTTICRVCNQ